VYQVNGLNWKIRLVRANSDMLRRSDNIYTLGSCDRVNRTIYISNKLKGEQLRKVLTHEVCHSVMFSYNVNLSIEQEEIVCQMISLYGLEILAIVDDILQTKRHVYFNVP
jgi:predicted SprT family Zn-dependent metalloprotease